MTVGQRTCYHLSHWHVATDTDTTENELSLKAWSKTVEQREGTLLSSNFRDSSEETVVARCLSSFHSLNLETDFCGVDRNGADFSSHTSG